MKKRNGYTTLELMISLVLFSILTLICIQLLNNVVFFNHAAKKQSNSISITYNLYTKLFNETKTSDRFDFDVATSTLTTDKYTFHFDNNEIKIDNNCDQLTVNNLSTSYLNSEFIIAFELDNVGYNWRMTRGNS